MFASLFSIRALAIGLPIAWAACLCAQAATRVVAATGDAAVRGTGLIDSLRTPIIHNSGHVAFSADLRDKGSLVGSGIFRGDGQGRTVDVIALEGDPTPDINGNLVTSPPPDLFMNGRGDVTFATLLSRTLGGAQDHSAAYLGRGDQPLHQIVRANQPAPTGTNRFAEIYSAVPVNGAGQVAFLCGLRTPPSLFSDSMAIYRSDGTNFSLIVRERGPVPGETGTFLSFSTLSLNDAGQVMFAASLGILDSGIFRGGGSSLVKILRDGDSAPNGNGEFFAVSQVQPAFNDRGEIGFVGYLQETELDQADARGVFRGDETGLIEVVRSGALVPDRNGRFAQFGLNVALNNRGQVLFLGDLTGASGGANSGLFLGDGTNLIAVARLTDRAPGGGRFSEFHAEMFALNNAGQVAFYARLSAEAGETNPSSFGLFFYDPVLRLLAVARDNQPLFDFGEISFVEFTGGLGWSSRSHTGLNDNGEVAYRCSAGPGAVIAVWSVADIANNLPPVSPGFNAFANQGETLRLSVSNLLSVVTDPEGGKLTLISAESKSAQGGIVSRTAMAIDYSPPAGFLGDDQFRYDVADDAGGALTVVARITVLNQNHAPGNMTIAVSAPSGQPVVLSVSNLLSQVTDPDGDALTLILPGTGTMGGGSVTRDGDQITAVPSLLVRGGDSIVFQVADGRGGLGSLVVRFQTSTTQPANRIERVEIGPEGISVSFALRTGVWHVERAESIAGPWTRIGSLTVLGGGRGSTSGTARFTDTDLRPGAAFHRAAQ